MQGPAGDGTGCEYPACPSPTEEYYPNTPICYRGCCPTGATCLDSVWSVPACTDSATDGYITDFTPVVPTINSLSVAEGLPINSASCACDDLTCQASCTDSDWDYDGKCDVAQTPVF